MSNFMGNFTRRELDIALKVLKQTRAVRAWALGEMRSFGIDPDTPQGREIFDGLTTKHAKKLLKF